MCFGTPCTSVGPPATSGSHLRVVGADPAGKLVCNWKIAGSFMAAPPSGSDDHAAKYIDHRWAEVSAKLDQLHALYGRDQPLVNIIDGLNTRLAYARQLYGLGRSIPQVVNGLYERLDKLRKLYNLESIEAVIDDVITWRLRFNRLVELQSKVMVSEADYDEMRAISAGIQARSGETESASPPCASSGILNRNLAQSTARTV